jgi:hypothetical protein
MIVAASIVDLQWWRLPYPGGKDALKQEVEKIILSHREAELNGLQQKLIAAVQQTFEQEKKS